MPCPICGAASPTPGAAYIVSFICSISSRISRLRISFGRRARAGRRRTGSPAWTMVRGIKAHIVHGSGDTAKNESAIHHGGTETQRKTRIEPQRLQRSTKEHKPL